MKCVYLECPGDKGRNKEESEGIRAMRAFVKSNLKYGSTGIRDKHLEVPSSGMGDRQGTLHFIKFETVRMCGFMDMVTQNGLGKFSKIVCATGGGAYKFEDDFKKVLYVHVIRTCGVHAHVHVIWPCICATVDDTVYVMCLCCHFCASL